MAFPEPKPGLMRISFGPQHPMSGQTRLLLDVDGEKVHQIIADLGYTHRGIEKMLENRTLLGGLIPVDRMNMVDTANMSIGYVIVADKAYGLEVPERAHWLRSLVCEMGRVNSHLYAFGLQAEATGYFPAVFLWTTVDREVLLDLFEELTGARWSFSYFTPGGVRWDVPEGFTGRVLEAVKYLRNRFKDYWTAMVENPMFEMRTVNVGILKPKDAIRLGATGPVLRGSGVDLDIRKEDPYAAYADLDFEVITESGCDVMARTKVRLLEIDQSLNMMEQIAKELPEGDIKTRFSAFMRAPEGEHFSRVETSRGEMGFHVYTNGTTNPYRVKINSPTLRNMYVLERLAELNDITMADIPVLLYSIDPWYLDCDR